MRTTDSQIVAAAVKHLHVLEAAVSRRSDARYDLSAKASRGAIWKTIATGSKDFLLAWVNEHNPAIVSSVESGRTIARREA
jgi:hypothetical protein